jgi:hypothetical protein
LDERIAGHVTGAAAHGDMTDHGAHRVNGANTGARVQALVAYARSVTGTVSVQDAFRPATYVRVSSELWQTSADAIGTCRVGTAG